MRIVLDAGHGGKDPGAIGNGLKEKELTLKLALKTGAYLTSCFNFDVVYTRKKDIFLSLSERAKIANKEKAAFFCSFHINSASTENARGFETYRYPGTTGKTELLQRFVHEKVMKFVGKNGIIDRGMKQQNFAVVRQTIMPAILTESLFLSNPHDAALLRSETFIDKIAYGHAVGIAQAAGKKGVRSKILFKMKKSSLF